MLAPARCIFACCTLLLLASTPGCGSERDAANDGRVPDDAAEGSAPPEAPAMPGDAVAGDDAQGASAEVLPGPCHAPAPPQLCIAGDAVDAAREDVRLGSNSRRVVVTLEGRLLAAGEGAWPEGAPAGACDFAPAALEAEPGGEIRLAWARLDVDGREAWVSISAPEGASPFVVGEALRVAYTELDDYLADFGPASRSLTLRDDAGGLLAWLGSSGEVGVLSAEGPAEVGLELGAARCAEVRGCSRNVQHALHVGVAEATSVLEQGELATVGGFGVLVGQSETAQPSSDCELDGTPQLASVALWRFAP